ncbi:homer protein homolog 2 isoform X2 [Octopus sinensis]|uniref:Homer-like protein 2 n=2 Tax=Octopus TaxID=6643 RepID=A0A9Y1D1F3_OCTVU|nr:homer protein homolog 2 isoform X2 [Octopus sinensis]UUA79790.1 homer-like protein 2 [Octopus vulgaris]
MNSGEQPLFSCRAHVFHMGDQESKKHWIQISKTAAVVHFYYDNARATYRIISVEDSKAVVNSTVTASMVFTKTSQKFGQWSDVSANIVYGLGFSGEKELNQFHDYFEEVKLLTRKHSKSKQEINGAMDNDTLKKTGSSPINPLCHTRTSSLSSLPISTSNLQDQRRGSLSSSATSLPGNVTEAHLKYENDRLKLALAQSSTNTKKWEIELQTLKANNQRLTTALQESTANVEEWKKQLAAYKEENARLKKRVQELESLPMSSEQSNNLVKAELSQVTSRLNQVQLDSSNKMQEIELLHRRIKELSNAEAENAILQAKIQKIDADKEKATVKAENLQRLLNEAKSTYELENNEVLELHNQLSKQLKESLELQELIVATVKRESQS